MSARITFSLQVPIKFSKGQDAEVLAVCPLLDVCAEGSNRSEASARLEEALQLFIESCYTAGTLDRVLMDAGFHRESEENDAGTISEESLNIPFTLIAQAHGRETACA